MDSDDKEDAVDIDVDLVSSSSSSTPSSDLAENESSDDEDDSMSATWISWFCSLEGNEFFCRISDDFLGDSFNLTGLAAEVPCYQQALELIQEVEPDREFFENPKLALIETAAERLYGLIHQRYIITKQGLAQMGLKYEAGVFGICPRTNCECCKLAPTGQSDSAGVDMVKLFCPRCRELYLPASAQKSLDGAFFGTTMAHLLFSSYPHLLGSISSAPVQKYQPPPQFSHRPVVVSVDFESASAASTASSLSATSSPESSINNPAGPTTASSLAAAHTRMRTMTKWLPRWENGSSDDEDEDAPSTMPHPKGQPALVAPQLLQKQVKSVAPLRSSPFSPSTGKRKTPAGGF